MALCIRAVPSKLSTFAGPRKQLTQLDRRLTKYTEHSAVLEKYDTLGLSDSKRENVIPKVSLQEKSTIGIKNNILRSYSTFTDRLKEMIPPENQGEEEKKVEGEEESPQKQLEKVYKTLSKDLPYFFAASLDYRIYHHKLIFINNLKGVKTEGIHNYIKQMLYLRTMGHLSYAFVKFDVLKMTMHPEDMTVRVRWRIRGVSGLKTLAMFWKFKIFKISESISELESWHDGFSTYYIGPDGLVFKLVADKVMPDEDEFPSKDKTDITAKLAV